MDELASPIRATISIPHSFGREPLSGMRNYGTINPGKPSICSFPSHLMCLIYPLRPSKRSSGWMWACASLSVTSTSTGRASFHPGKRTRHQANHYARLRPPLAEERHSWGETPHPEHYPTRETVQTASQSHARQTDHQRAPPHPDQLQSGALRFPGGQSRCRLHLAAVSDVRAYRRGEPSRQGVVVCLSEPSVRLYPAC